MTSVEDLIYPNVTKSKRVGITGAEVIKIWTKDDFEKVKKFYQDRLGRPIKEDSEENEASFVSVGKSKITVTIKPDDDLLVISVGYVALSIPNFR